MFTMTVDPASKILRQVSSYAMAQKKYQKKILESFSNNMFWLWIAGNTSWETQSGKVCREELPP